MYNLHDPLAGPHSLLQLECNHIVKAGWEESKKVEGYGLRF